ncbi:MAG: UDP-N-acetylmuramoyl-L-alanine--D-glutamate ligase [Patescibacteria group bacterium]
MYTKDWFKGKKVTVMGLGLHGGGLGVTKWLLRAGAKVTVTDLKSKLELEKSIRDLARLKTVRQPKYVLGRHDERDFTTADLVIRNPAVRRDNPYLLAAERHDVPVETEAALFILLCPFPVTAVTGTKGKSTTVTLLGDIMRQHDERTVIGGNIRISQFDSLDRLLAAARRGERPIPVVLELSSWQLEGLEKHHFSPHIGVVTNIMEDHLNAYSGMADYARAKSLVIAYQSSHDIAIINQDDARVATMGERRRPAGAKFRGRRFPFSVRPLRGDGCFVRQGKLIIRDGRKETSLLSLSDLLISGQHNVPNVLAACAAAYMSGVPTKTISVAAKKFRGVSGRLEDVARLHEIRFVNDTTATMPDASIAALKALSVGRKKTIVLIAGGAKKGLHYRDWAVAATKYVKALVLLDGTETPTLERELKRAGYTREVWLVDSMNKAVQLADSLADGGDTVLLSPACSSFGMFLNEFDRGDQFVTAVKKLKE